MAEQNLMQAECRVMSGGGLVLVVPHHEIANALDILNRINKNIKLLHQKKSLSPEKLNCPECFLSSILFMKWTIKETI